MSVRTDLKKFELDIQALVDRQLDQKEEWRVLTLLQHSARARARYEALQSQKNLLNAWFWDTVSIH